MMPVISPPMRKEIRFGHRWAKSLAGLTTLAAMLVASVARQSDSIENDQHNGLRELRQQLDRVPDRLAVDDDRRRGDGHADERVQPHRRRQAERLAEDLVALRVGIAAEVGDVQRQRRPEADVGRQGREEERSQNWPCFGPPGGELRRLREHRPEAARLRSRPRPASARPRTISSGALMFSRMRIDSIPR